MRLLLDAQRPLLTNVFAEFSDALASAFDDVDFVDRDRTILILHG